MTTFIKTKFKISADQTNIDNYRLDAKITKYHIISKLILQRIIITNFCDPNCRKTSFLKIKLNAVNKVILLNMT